MPRSDMFFPNTGVFSDRSLPKKVLENLFVFLHPGNAFSIMFFYNAKYQNRSLVIEINVSIPKIKINVMLYCSCILTYSLIIHVHNEFQLYVQQLTPLLPSLLLSLLFPSCFSSFLVHVFVSVCVCVSDVYMCVCVRMCEITGLIMVVCISIVNIFMYMKY